MSETTKSIESGAVKGSLIGQGLGAIAGLSLIPLVFKHAGGKRNLLRNLLKSHDVGIELPGKFMLSTHRPTQPTNALKKQEIRKLIRNMKVSSVLGLSGAGSLLGATAGAGVGAIHGSMKKEAEEQKDSGKAMITGMVPGAALGGFLGYKNIKNIMASVPEAERPAYHEFLSTNKIFPILHIQKGVKHPAYTVFARSNNLQKSLRRMPYIAAGIGALTGTGQGAMIGYLASKLKKAIKGNKNMEKVSFSLGEEKGPEIPKKTLSEYIKTVAKHPGSFAGHLALGLGGGYAAGAGLGTLATLPIAAGAALISKGRGKSGAEAFRQFKEKMSHGLRSEAVGFGGVGLVAGTGKFFNKYKDEGNMTKAGSIVVDQIRKNSFDNEMKRINGR